MAIITIADAIRKIEQLSKHPIGDEHGVDAQTVWSLTSDGGGGFCLFAVRNGAPVVIDYDRGDVRGVAPFGEWVGSLVETWRQESAKVRAEFVRVRRSPMGATVIEISSRGRKRVAQAFSSGEGFAIVAHVPKVRVRIGEPAGEGRTNCRRRH